MTELFYIIFTILFILLIILIINVSAGPFLKTKKHINANPMVSILIPARNEAGNISECLEGLRNQSYNPLEILVLDDESEDKTAAIVKDISHMDDRIKFINGKALPRGWTGKNWACHQLSTVAVGEIFIFTDADNRYHPQAVENTVAWMQSLDLGMFSAFPQQITKSIGEKLIIPVVDLFLYSALVLWSTYFTKFVSTAAANGQWIAFRNKTYQQIGGHKSIKNKIVEDIELSRKVKRHGIKMLTTAGTGIVFGKMYSSFTEVWEGFSKNIFGILSSQTFSFIIILHTLLLIFVFPYFLLFFSKYFFGALILIGLGITIRFLASIKYKQPVLASVVLHPVSILMIYAIGINSFYQTKMKRVKWKGRTVSIVNQKIN